MTDERDDAQESSPESLLQFISEHNQRRGERNHRRRNVAVLLGIVAVALTLAAVGFVVWGNSGQPPSVSHGPPAGTDSRKNRSHPTPPSTTRAGTTQDGKASPSKPIHVTLTAARSDSWVEIRKGSSTGRVLFAGVVSEGKSIHVVGHRLWARFGALGNFDLTVDGRPVHPPFNGTVDTFITAAAIRQAPTG